MPGVDRLHRLRMQEQHGTGERIGRAVEDFAAQDQGARIASLGLPIDRGA